jgi:Fic family protein
MEAQAGNPIDDIREVSNYVDAMMFGLERLEGLPMSLRLIREMHARLLQSGRGGTKSPGEFRRSQNWIGGSRPGNALFVPPPVTEMDVCPDALEQSRAIEPATSPVQTYDLMEECGLYFSSSL